MTDTECIVEEIEKLVVKMRSYGAWIICLSNDPEAFRKSNVANDLHSWHASSFQEAKNIRDHFREQGMVSHDLDEDGECDWVLVY